MSNEEIAARQAGLERLGFHDLGDDAATAREEKLTKSDIDYFCENGMMSTEDADSRRPNAPDDE